MATVVAKLLNQCGPDLAVFGEKDFQQLQVIRRLVRDLDMPVEVIGAPTARASDGLALSSRNAYLTSAQRKIAPQLHRELIRALARLRAAEPVASVEADAVRALADAGFDSVDYFEVREPRGLTRLGPGSAIGPVRVLAAAHLGRARLIDNVGD